MTTAIPPVWASNTNYSAGPDTGSPTCVDPASAANGFIRGVIAAPQHVNFELNTVTLAARRALAIACLQLRQIEQDGVTVTDTTERMAAVQRNQGTPLLAFKVAQAFALGDWSRITAQGVPASISTSVRGAATNGTRILVVGESGNRSTFSDDDGATWTAGGDIGATADHAVWDATLGFFLAANTAGGRVSRSTNGVAWANSTGDLVVGAASVAVMSNGDVYGIASGAATFVKSTDGIAFANTAGGPPGTGTLDDVGCMAGNAGSVFYHAGRHSSGANIVISSSSDGITSTTLATLTPQGSASFSAQPRLMMCQNTGLLVLAVSTSGNQCALYASTNGTDWIGPHVLFPDPGRLAFALAGGRLFGTINDMLFASDGLGY